jgi:hypothetical protein
MQPSPRSPGLGLLLLFLVLAAACIGELPPPPNLLVTSPERGLVQSGAGTVVVKGTALPGPDGASIRKVTINKTPATLAPDGSFTATVQVPEGATLLETIAISAEGGTAIDARAVHVGELRPVGSRIDRAISATLSANAFAKISAAASQTLKATDLSALIAPVSFGDSTANLKLTITKLAIAGVTIALVPVDGGLQLQVVVDGLDVGAIAAYAGVLVPDGSTTIGVTAQKITIGGTLVVTPNGTGGFKTTVASPSVTTTALNLQASGVAGEILDLLNRYLSSAVNSITTRSAELALEPGVNAALGALGGPQQFVVLGTTVDLEASASEIQFSGLGALASLNLQAKIGGSASNASYIFTANGTPDLDMGRGIELALSDDLLNDMFAQVHALGVLDVHLEEDFGLFDTVDIKATLPPMISANTSDGSVRLVLGDLIATVTNNGKTLVRAALNAQVDVQIARGNSPDEIAVQLGKVHVFANLLDDPETPGAPMPAELAAAANAGIGLQLDSLNELLITVPIPAIAGVSVDSLSLRGDSGYIVAGGQIR